MVVGRAIDYLESVRALLAPVDSTVTAESLMQMLSVERLSMELMSAYMTDLTKSSEHVERVLRALRQAE